MTNSALVGDAASDWIAATARRLGRPLRVLHIGNIANNGFLNARIQRAQGIAADVLCADSYHIMSSPEWEEADFATPPANAFFPDWWALDLHGYQRPRWFAGAPLADACRYLEAWAAGDAVGADARWRIMERERFVRCSTSRAAGLGLFRRKVGWKVAYEWRRLARRLGVAEAAAESSATRLGGRGLAALRAMWDRRRPGRPFPVTAADLMHYWERLGPVCRLLPLYDIVQGNAQEGIWALLAGRRYAAYEHGTLRSLPFEDNPTGRIVALVYGLADHVFVSNLDCLASADRLGLDPVRVTAHPHPFDDERLRAFRDAHADLAPPPDRVRLIMPSRQDWRDGDPNLAKGNDRFFRAAATLNREGVALEIIAAAWGRDLDASRALVAELDLTEQVKWVSPMRKPDLWRVYLTSHAVVDQFRLPAFGNTTCEALALGRRVVSSLDIDAATRFFGAVPPMLACGSEPAIAAALRQIAADPRDTAGTGRAAIRWVSDRHSAHRVLALQTAAYRQILESPPP